MRITRKKTRTSSKQSLEPYFLSVFCTTECNQRRSATTPRRDTCVFAVSQPLFRPCLLELPSHAAVPTADRLQTRRPEKDTSAISSPNFSSPRMCKSSSPRNHSRTRPCCCPDHIPRPRRSLMRPIPEKKETEGTDNRHGSLDARGDAGRGG